MPSFLVAEPAAEPAAELSAELSDAPLVDRFLPDHDTKTVTYRPQALKNRD
jgi:hypothetical protein